MIKIWTFNLFVSIENLMLSFSSSLKVAFTPLSLFTMAATSWPFSTSVAPQHNNQLFYRVLYIPYDHCVLAYCRVCVYCCEMGMTTPSEDFWVFTMAAFSWSVGSDEPNPYNNQLIHCRLKRFPRDIGNGGSSWDRKRSIHHRQKDHGRPKTRFLVDWLSYFWYSKCFKVIHNGVDHFHAVLLVNRCHGWQKTPLFAPWRWVILLR